MNVPATIGLVGLIAFLLAAIILYICKKRLGVEPETGVSGTTTRVKKEIEACDSL